MDDRRKILTESLSLLSETGTLLVIEVVMNYDCLQTMRKRAYYIDKFSAK